MPSRQIPPQPLAAPTPPPHHRHHPLTSRLIPPLSISAAAAVSILLLFTLCFRKITRKRTVPSDSKPPHRFSYSALRRATANFSSSLRLGQGGFGSVYRGTLPNNQFIAVKVMDSGSLQGEREFHNELYFASRLESPYVITAIGFSSDRKRKTMLLVYELMLNGNLQDALLKRKCEELMDWKQRFSVAVDIAKGLEYLHCLDPPVIHGDVKPSNVLLDRCFSAKLADFGLAWTKMENLNENQDVANGNMSNLGGSKKGETESVNGGGAGVDENVSIVETESVVTCGFEDFNFVPDQSPESFVRGPSQEIVEAVSASPEVGSNLEGISVKNGKEPGEGGKAAKGVNNGSVKDWWWKQENSNLGENKVVKDYVMEWIGSEIKERPNSEWMGASSSTSNHVGKKIDKKKKNRKRLDWWLSMDEDKDEKVLKKEKRRLPREWWKEEYCEELEKKKKKKNKKQRETMVMNGDGNGNGVEVWWPKDENLYADKKKRSRSRSSRGSVDWMSGELFRPQQNSTDSYNGDIPKSGGISSTPSMRGTLCYVAPEYGSGGALSEKSDVYSFGVLLLVLISGRRPLQVTSSPMSEFQRANLIHWTRNLARARKLLDLVDQSVQSLDRDQALTCITVALLCLQKSPVRRPSMKEVVEMLTGESEAPQLPTEFSPSPPSRFPFKARSRRKAQ